MAFVIYQHLYITRIPGIFESGFINNEILLQKPRILTFFQLINRSIFHWKRLKMIRIDKTHRKNRFDESTNVNKTDFTSYLVHFIAFNFSVLCTICNLILQSQTTKFLLSIQSTHFINLISLIWRIKMTKQLIRISSLTVFKWKKKDLDCPQIKYRRILQPLLFI